MAGELETATLPRHRLSQISLRPAPPPPFWVIMQECAASELSHDTFLHDHRGLRGLWTTNSTVPADIGTLFRVTPRLPVPAELRAMSAFRLSDAKAAGVTSTQLRARQYGHPFHGVHASRSLTDLADLCRAALLVLPDQAVFSDETVASLHGLPAPHCVALHVCVPETSGVTVRRRGIVGHVRHLTELDIGRCFDLPVTTPERTFLDLAGRLPAGELLGFVDAALRARLATMPSLLDVLVRHAGCRGVAKARRVLGYANSAAESPRESMMRWLLIEAGLPTPEVNVNIYDLDGVFLARADMLFRKARVIVEYDGDQHRTDRAQFVHDIQRTTRLAAAGYLVLRFTGSDLMTRPGWIVETVVVALRARG